MWGRDTSYPCSCCILLNRGSLRPGRGRVRMHLGAGGGGGREEGRGVWMGSASWVESVDVGSEVLIVMLFADSVEVDGRMMEDCKP